MIGRLYPSAAKNESAGPCAQRGDRPTYGHPKRSMRKADS
jgi:hypothetical protein